MDYIYLTEIVINKNSIPNHDQEVRVLLCTKGEKMFKNMIFDKDELSFVDGNGSIYYILDASVISWKDLNQK